MRCNVERVVVFINALFSVIFLIHISAIGYNILYPDVPEIIVSKKNLNEIEFPMTFRICAFDLYDTDSKYKLFGYESYKGFFRGMSMFNDTLYGWAGHDQNGSVLGSVEGDFLKDKFLLILESIYRCSFWGFFQLDRDSLPNKYLYWKTESI